MLKQAFVKKAGSILVASPTQQMAEVLDNRSLKGRGECSELTRIDAASQFGKDRDDMVKATTRVRVAQQIERRQLRRGWVGLTLRRFMAKC